MIPRGYRAVMRLYDRAADGESDSHAAFGVRGKRTLILTAEDIWQGGFLYAFSVVDHVEGDRWSVVSNNPKVG